MAAPVQHLHHQQRRRQSRVAAQHHHHPQQGRDAVHQHHRLGRCRRHLRGMAARHPGQCRHQQLQPRRRRHDRGGDHADGARGQPHADPEEALHHLHHPGGGEEGRPRERDQLPDGAGRPPRQDGSRGHRLPEPGLGRPGRRGDAQDGRLRELDRVATSRAAPAAPRAASPRATPWRRPTARSAPRPRRC